MSNFILTQPIYSSKVGNSDDIFWEIMFLHVPRDSVVLDMTSNKGTFWRQIPGIYHAWFADLSSEFKPHVQCDLAALPFRKDTFDAAVLDPPYGNMSTAPRRDGIGTSYNMLETRGKAAVYALYYNGMTEAARVLRPKGKLIVKCQAFVNCGKQWWLDHDILDMAPKCLSPIDRFWLIPKTNPIMRHKGRQVHARKKGSTFWVFQKAAAARVRLGEAGY